MWRICLALKINLAALQQAKKPILQFTRPILHRFPLINQRTPMSGGVMFEREIHYVVRDKWQRAPNYARLTVLATRRTNTT